MSVVIQKHVLTLKFTVSCKHLYRANFVVFLKCWDFLKLSSVCYYHRGSWNCDLSKAPPGPGRVGIFFSLCFNFYGVFYAVIGNEPKRPSFCAFHPPLPGNSLSVGFFIPRKSSWLDRRLEVIRGNLVKLSSCLFYAHLIVQ